MNITLAYLNEIGACIESLRAFKARFGADGAPSAREVFEALAAADRRDWAIWIAERAHGFCAAVGNVESGNWRASIDARIEAAAGFVLASGSATVRAYGSATVEAYDSATVEAYDSATVEAYGESNIILFARWSLRVSLTLSEKAVCVDRRSGEPKLLTAETAPE